MNWKTRRISFTWIFDKVERRVDSYEGKPVPNGQVASGDRQSIDSVGSGFGSVQRDSKLSRTLCQILSIEWGDGGVPGGIGTFLVDSRCLMDQFLVRRHFARRPRCF